MGSRHFNSGVEFGLQLFKQCRVFVHLGLEMKGFHVPVVNLISKIGNLGMAEGTTSLFRHDIQPAFEVGLDGVVCRHSLGRRVDIEVYRLN